MGAVWMRARSESRARRRAMIGLVLVAALVGGAAIAAAAGARRTQSAYPRFVQEYRGLGGDVSLSTGRHPDTEAVFDRVERISGVVAVNRSALFIGAVTTPAGRTVRFPDVFLIAEQSAPREGLPPRFKMLDGRVSDPHRPDEVMAAYVMAERLGVRPGDRVTITLIGGFFEEEPPTEVVLPDIQVTGIYASVGSFETLTGDGFPTVLALTPAFFDAHHHLRAVGEENLGVILRDGEAGVDALEAEIRRLGLPADTATRASVFTPGVQALNQVPATALWLVAGLLALVTLAVVGATLSREVAASGEEFPALRALGMSRRQIFSVALTRAAVVAVAAGGLAVAMAFLLSPLTPIGLGRIAEPDPGFAFDAVVLIGAGLLVAGLLLLVSWPAWRLAGARAEASSRARASALVAAMGRASMPASAVAGAHLALDPGRGGRAVPASTSMLGAAGAVAALVAALSFGAGLDHLLAHPELSGYAWDAGAIVWTPEAVEHVAAAAQETPGITAAWKGTAFPTVSVGGTELVVLASDGPGPSIMAGRAPRAGDEVALDGKTLRAAGLRIGDAVPVASSRGDGSPIEMSVVGRVAVPRLPFSPDNPGQAVAMTLGGLQRVDPGSDYDAVYVRFVPDLDLDHGVERLRAAAEGAFAVFSRKQATTVRNVGRLTQTPIMLSGLLGVLGAAILAHVLAMTIRRRRRDLAILRTVGFVSRQVRAAVAWQSSLLVAFALLVGLPLGLVTGRWGWRAFAEYLDVVPAPVTPALAAVAVACGTLAMANLIAAFPARAAARTQPAVVLRSE